MSQGFMPSARQGRRLVFVRGLEVQALLGMHPNEKAARQRVVIGVELSVEEEPTSREIGPDDLRRVVNYERVVSVARAEAASAHTLLVETLAERIAVAILDDPRVRAARVTIEKPDIFTDAAAVGVTVEREAA